MEPCDQLIVPSAGDDPFLIMDLWANSYKQCKMKQAGLARCIKRHNEHSAQ